MKTSTKNQEHNIVLFGGINMVILCCFVFNNCQRIDEKIDYNLDIPEAYKEVGVSHSEGLDFIFTRLQECCIKYGENYDSDPLNLEAIDYRSVVREALEEFCKIDPITKEMSVVYEALLHENILHKSGHVQNIPSGVKVLLDRIQVAISNEFLSKNYKQLKRELNSINQMAAVQLSKEDASSIFYATSTAYSSFQYWNKNFRAWYFALNYPEIVNQLKKSDLNKLSLKSTTSVLDTVPIYQSVLKRFWDSFEGWLQNTGDALDCWWEEYGEKIIISDCLGAIAGAYDAAVAAGAASLVMGPEGLVVVGTAGAIIGGIDASAFAITGSGVMELINP